MCEKADEVFVAEGCLGPGELLADLKRQRYAESRACRRRAIAQQNAEAAAAYQRLMDGLPDIDQAAAQKMDKPPVRTMPAHALNRGPQRIGLSRCDLVIF